MEVGEQGVFYSLEVDRVGFEPAAVGFFRVGFLHSVLLENVRLTVRADPGAFRRSNPADAVESALASLLEQRELAAPEWFGGFTGASATLLHIRVLQDDQEALALSSQRASVDVRRRQLDLQGQVRVAVDGGAKVLESDALHLSLETLQFWTNGEVRLQVGGQRHRSVGFRSDVFLAEVGGQPEDQVGQQIRRGQMRDWGPEERGS